MAHKLFILLLLPAFSFSQKTVDVAKNDVNPVRDGLFYVVGGVPFSPVKYVRVVSGSAYYSETWMSAKLLLRDGGQSKSSQVKLDLLSGELIYKDSTGSELIATTPIIQATLTDPYSGKDYVFAHSSAITLQGKEADAGWYQLLESGNATLYKKIHKVLTEYKPYNSATTEQTISTVNKYFIAFNNTVISVKKPKDIAAALDKKAELEAFISSRKLNGKEETDFTAVVAYYNALLSK